MNQGPYVRLAKERKIDRRVLFGLYAALLPLKRRFPVLSNPDKTPNTNPWHPGGEEVDKDCLVGHRQGRCAPTLAALLTSMFIFILFYCYNCSTCFYGIE